MSNAETATRLQPSKTAAKKWAGACRIAAEGIRRTWGQGFDNVGETVQTAIIRAAAWDSIKSGSNHGTVEITREDIVAIEVGIRKTVG